MPVRVDALADYIRFYEASGLPTFTNYTVTYWEQVVVDNAGTNRMSYLLQNSSFGAAHKIGRAGDNVDRGYGQGVDATFSSNLSTTEWVMWAITCQGTGATDLKFYAWNATDADGSYKSCSTTGNTPSGGISGWCMGSNFGTSEFRNARYAYIKVWDAVLTLSELQAERTQGKPVKTSNVNRYHRLLDNTDTTDYSGNSRPVTFNGAITTDGTEPVAWEATTLPLMGQICI